MKIWWSELLSKKDTQLSSDSQMRFECWKWFSNLILCIYYLVLSAHLLISWRGILDWDLLWERPLGKLLLFKNSIEPSISVGSHMVGSVSESPDPESMLSTSQVRPCSFDYDDGLRFGHVTIRARMVPWSAEEKRYCQIALTAGTSDQCKLLQEVEKMWSASGGREY